MSDETGRAAAEPGDDLAPVEGEDTPRDDGRPDVHPLVEALVANPENPPRLTTIEGFVGDSSVPGCLRLYLDEELSRWYDVPTQMIVHFEELPRDVSRLGMTILWLDRQRVEANGHRQGPSGRFP